MIRKYLLIVYPWFPIVGLGLYLMVFPFAASHYPGGSINIPQDQGYSFFHNFLCDVMNPTTPTGVVNTGRPLAIVSHLILSFAMISFFYLLPKIFDHQNRRTQMIRWFGMLTMFVFVFMYTPHHDYIVTATGILGTMALVPFFIEVQRSDRVSLRRLAYVCYTLSIIVFFIFETKIGFYYLPMLQKITFVFDAWWVVWVSLIVLARNRAHLGWQVSPSRG
ncbi:MAG: hypothetical protein HKN87_20040 [Saprospiraceae bacterium]|nr:hypothetical protein [Saprospiraceae bacterium]